MEDPIDHREDAHGPATSLDRNDPDLRISARRVYAVLLVCIAGLVAAGVASSVLKFTYGYQSAFTLIPLFDLDREGNVPAWFSSLLLFSIALLLGIIGAGKAKSRDRWRWHWIGLAVIFVLLSMDEAASLHERLTVPLRNALDLSGALYFAWVVPAGALLIVFAAVYIRFLLALPKRTGRLFVIAACLYVGGALGVELAGGAYASAYGRDSLAYGLIASCEETMEMLGLATFIYTLLAYLAVQSRDVRLNFDL